MSEKHRTLSKDARTRESIDIPKIVNLLSNHTFGLVKLEQGQIKTAEILLKKALPDIQMVNIDLTGGVTVEVLHVASHAPVKKAPVKKRSVKRNTSTK